MGAPVDRSVTGRAHALRRQDRTRTGATRAAAVLTATLVMGLGLVACGTRLSDRAFVGAGGGAAGSSGAGAVAGSSGGSGAGSSNNPSGGATAGPNGGPSGGSVTGGAGGTSTGGPTGGGTAGGGTGGGGGGGTGGGGSGGGASDVGVTDNSITLGNVTAINGALGPYAFGVTLPGLEAWASATNARGGINGRKIVLDTCDDSADGQQNLACATRLVSQNHVFAFLGNNTDACASSAHYESTNGVPDIGFPLCNGYYMYPTMFSYLGSGYPRKGSLPANQEQQAQVYKWFKDNRHVSKGAFFFYIIPISQQQGYASEQAAGSVGIGTTYEGGGNHEGENPANPTFDTDVINMRADHVDSIFDAIDTAGNAKLCSAMDRQGYTVPAKVSTVEVYGQAVATWSSPCRSSVYAADDSAAYSDTSNPVVAQFRKDFSTYQPNAELHEWALDGYSTGVLFADAVKSMGAKVTRAGLISWMNQWKQLQDGGPGYTYDGLTAQTAWGPENFGRPSPICTAISQWNDAANSFVSVAGPNTCYTMPFLSSPFSSDGS